MIFQCEDCGSYFAEDEMTDGFEHLVQKYDKETGHSWIECPLCGCEIVDEPLQDHEIAEELNFYRLELKHLKHMIKILKEKRKVEQ